MAIIAFVIVVISKKWDRKGSDMKIICIIGFGFLCIVALSVGFRAGQSVQGLALSSQSVSRETPERKDTLTVEEMRPEWSLPIWQSAVMDFSGGIFSNDSRGDLSFISGTDPDFWVEDDTTSPPTKYPLEILGDGRGEYHLEWLLQSEKVSPSNDEEIKDKLDRLDRSVRDLKAEIILLRNTILVKKERQKP